MYILSKNLLAHRPGTKFSRYSLVYPLEESHLNFGFSRINDWIISQSNII